jgi:hypothetical protein
MENHNSFTGEPNMKKAAQKNTIAKATKQPATDLVDSWIAYMSRNDSNIKIYSVMAVMILALKNEKSAKLLSAVKQWIEDIQDDCQKDTDLTSSDAMIFGLVHGMLNNGRGEIQLDIAVNPKTA